MNGLSEEQRQRMETNRQLALDKQKQRNIQRRDAPIDRSANDGRSNAVARESFGDSSIDWGAAAQEMDRVLALPETSLSLHQNNMTGGIHIQNRNLECKSEMFYRSVINDTSQQTEGVRQSQSTDEQRIRHEKNRRQAIEKNRKTLEVVSASSHPNFARASGTVTDIIDLTLLNKKPSTTQPESAHAPKLSLTEEQRATIEKKRLSALKRKHSSQLISDGLVNTPQYTATVGSMQNPHRVLKEQRGLIDLNKQMELRTASDATSHVGCSTEKYLLEQQNNIDECTNLNDHLDLITCAGFEQPDVCIPLSSQKQLNTRRLPKLPPELQYPESKCQPINDGHIDTLIDNAELDRTLLNGWSLYDHQKEGVRRALQMRRLILAFDMGLGKTIIGCVWSKAFLKTFRGIKVFVIAPVSLMEDWRRTAKEATGLNVDDGKKNKQGEKSKKKQIKMLSLDIKERTSSVDMHVFSWSSVVDCQSIVIKNANCEYVVIFDEAHNMQSRTSKRTVDSLTLISSKRCKGVLLLSGTPMKNGRPSNLFPLLKAVDHPFGSDQKRFEFYFCNGQNRMINGRDVWDAGGSSNLKELHAHTVSHVFRMTKDECMAGELSPRKREYNQIQVSSRHELRYNQTLKELAQAFDAMKSNVGRDPNDTDNILKPFNQLRQASSLAKVDATVALANKILQDEGSLVIFTSFVAIAKSVHSTLTSMSWSGHILTGETLPAKRQAMVDDFQTGITPVFVCTYGAGGVGLTLTAACTVILIDRPWTPGDVTQAEDRVRRIGQTRPVKSIWMRAFPIDHQIDDLIDHKEGTSHSAVDGRELCGGNRMAPKISISELVKTVLGGQDDWRTE